MVRRTVRRGRVRAPGRRLQGAAAAAAAARRAAEAPRGPGRAHGRAPALVLGKCHLTLFCITLYKHCSQTILLL